MLFSALTFLYIFLPLVLVGHLLLRKTSYRNIFLLFSSLLFYAWGEGWLVLLMIGSISFNWLFGAAIWEASNSENPLKKKLILSLGVGLNLALLALFKYSGFFVENLNLILATAGFGPVELGQVKLPIGISFFTFQAISYLVDVYYRPYLMESNPLRVGLYISLFPQLIAGPIVRYGDIFKQIRERVLTENDFVAGIRRFITGLAKKVLIADTLGSVADAIFELSPSTLEPGTAWLGLICYTLQIYFDFSGYSDMAIGIGRMLGFRILENFNYPYISKSIREFWRRWHISLSSWFRDYLYIPLGGNRKGLNRTIFNLLLVFFLCGLWHGANWTFVIWGLFHGIFLALERTPFGEWLNRFPLPLRHVYVSLIVMLGWVFFRTDNLDHAIDFFGAMVGFANEPRFYASFFLDREVSFFLVLGLLLSTPIYKVIEKYIFQIQKNKNKYLAMEFILLFALLYITGLYIASNGYNPFIYFRF